MKTLTQTLVKKTIFSILPYWLLLVGMLLLGGTACEKTDIGAEELQRRSYKETAKTTIHYGPAVPIGGGVGRTYIITNKDGKPTEVGVALSEKVLTHLPGHSHDDHGPEFVLQFPKGAERTPFRFVTLGWNPQGHEPKPIYAKPHFDFHFYMISDELRHTIPGLPPTEMDPQLPALHYLPADYIPTPGRIPAMGTHWVDKTSPELNGGDFSQTFIYGSYAHKIIFYEPMITLEYLLSRPQANMPIKQPQAFAEGGYFPTRYRIEFDRKAKEYRISLSDMKWQEAQ